MVYNHRYIRDLHGKQGKVGDTVMLCEKGQLFGEVLLITAITNNGRRGTILTFDNGQQCYTKRIQLVEAEKKMMM